MNIAIVTSTFPKNNSDNIPKFIKNQIINLKSNYPELNFFVLAPDNNENIELEESNHFKQIRFKYFWPRRFQVLTKNGIVNQLRRNFLNYLFIPFFFVSQFFYLFRLVKKEKINLIYAHWFFPQALNAFLVSKILKIPFVYTSHSSDVEIVKKRIPYLGKKIIRRISFEAKAISAPSKKIINKVKENFSTIELSDITTNVIPMGLNTKNVNLSKNENLNSDQINILFLGRFSKKKGVHLLIKSIYKISNELPEKKIKLILAGDGEEKDEYKSLINKYNLSSYVKFIGFIDEENKYGIINDSDLLIVPSIETKSGDIEGLPVVILEGLYCGKIVITSTYTNAQEIIKDYYNGFIVEDLNVDSLTNKIIDVINLDPKLKKTIQLNAKKLGERFNSENNAKEFYNSMINIL